MKPLLHVEAKHLEAAEGWLELGNYLEANQELEKITPQYRAHLDDLDMRWQVLKIVLLGCECEFTLRAGN